MQHHGRALKSIHNFNINFIHNFNINLYNMAGTAEALP